MFIKRGACPGSWSSSCRPCRRISFACSISVNALLSGGRVGWSRYIPARGVGGFDLWPGCCIPTTAPPRDDARVLNADRRWDRRRDAPAAAEPPHPGPLRSTPPKTPSRAASKDEDMKDKQKRKKERTWAEAARMVSGAAPRGRRVSVRLRPEEEAQDAAEAATPWRLAVSSLARSSLFARLLAASSSHLLSPNLAEPVSLVPALIRECDALRPLEWNKLWDAVFWRISGLLSGQLTAKLTASSGHEWG